MEAMGQVVKPSLAEMHKRLDLGLIPDEEIRRQSRIQYGKRRQFCYKPTHEEQVAETIRFANELRKMKMAMEVEELDSTLYQIPTPFLQILFGSYMKESCCYFKDDSMTLDEAEKAILELYCERAQIEDGQSILDLGCGYGSFTLYVAQKYKNCCVTALTNSLFQKEIIEGKCKELGLSNVKMILADVTTHEMEDTFDRVVAIELIEHMRNFELFLRKLAKWMKKDGLLFLEHACHKTVSQFCEATNEDEWLASYLLPVGTTMLPSSNILLYFQDDVTVVNHWTLSGKHFARTFEEWLKRLNSNMDAAKEILENYYGSKEVAEKMINYWKVLTITGTECYRTNNYEDWMVAHYLFKKKCC